MFSRILLFLTCLSFSSCYAQVDYSLIENWNSYVIPTNPDTLRKYNNSPNEWEVYLNGNKVMVSNTGRESKKAPLPFEIKPSKAEQYNMAGKRSVLKVDDGYLVGFYRGEWGGHLYWFSNNGKSHYWISDDEIVQLIQADGMNYAIQGLDHMSISEGSVISITKFKEKWRSKEYTKLPSAPYAIALDVSNNFIVLTSQNLIKIDKGAGITTLVEKGIWSNYLYPNSMVINGDILYAGMRSGVFKYNMLTKKQEWLLNY